MYLSSVPQLVVCLCFLQLFLCIQIWPLVFGVIFQGLLCPLISTWIPHNIKETKELEHTLQARNSVCEQMTHLNNVTNGTLITTELQI